MYVMGTASQNAKLNGRYNIGFYSKFIEDIYEAVGIYFMKNVTIKYSNKVKHLELGVVTLTTNCIFLS